MSAIGWWFQLKNELQIKSQLDQNSQRKTCCVVSSVNVVLLAFLVLFLPRVSMRFGVWSTSLLQKSRLAFLNVFSFFCFFFSSSTSCSSSFSSYFSYSSFFPPAATPPPLLSSSSFSSRLILILLVTFICMRMMMVMTLIMVMIVIVGGSSVVTAVHDYAYLTTRQLPLCMS